MRNRILTSLLFVLVLSLALTLVLVSCGGKEVGDVAPISPAQQPDATPPSQAQPSQDQPAVTDTPEESAAPAFPAPEVQAPASPSPQPDSQPSGQPVQSEPPKALTMAEAYRFALEGIFRDHLYPNGTEVDVPESEFFDMGNNDFAVFDVDGDGQDELIYQNDDSHTAGMITTIYGFDPETGKLYQELSGYVAMEFYDNGVVSIMASHNHGLAPFLEGFWPFALYQYDPGSDGYLMVAALDAWDGETYPRDHDMDLFPAEKDGDGDRILYIITSAGQEVVTTLVDGPEYGQWLDSYLAGATQLDLPWQAMTPENIQSVAP